MKRVLVTGLAGFVGHHVGEGILKNTDWHLVGLDRLDVSGTLHRLKDIEIWDSVKDRISFVWHDLKAPINEFVAEKIGAVDMIFHLAAATHVDRSIINPMEFVLDNVVATCNLLDFARALKTVEKIFYFSTDEVFGPAQKHDYQEWDRYKSSNPYAATKAGGEELSIAFENTYKLPVVITHCMNVFGERQHVEKFIPLVIKKILQGLKKD